MSNIGKKVFCKRSTASFNAIYRCSFEIRLLITLHYFFHFKRFTAFRLSLPINRTISCCSVDMMTAVAQWLRRCVTNRKFAGSIPASVNEFFVDIKSFRSHYGPDVDSVSNRNEYQEYFLRGKGDRSVRLATYYYLCVVVTKSGSPNFLEPSGRFQTCNGTALPFTVDTRDDVLYHRYFF